MISREHIRLFHKALRYLRERRDVSQLEVASTADLAPSTYNRYEKGKQKPNIPALIRILEALNMDFRDLQAAFEDMPGGTGPLGKVAGDAEPLTEHDQTIADFVDARLADSPELKKIKEELQSLRETQRPRDPGNGEQ